MSGGSNGSRVLVATFPGQGWDFGLMRHPFHDEEASRGAKYTVYNRRLMAACFDDSSPEQEYWLLRQRVGVLHTGERPLDIRGRDAERLLNQIMAGDVSKVTVGRCSYQFACYPDGGLLVDGVLLRLGTERFWYVQADGDLYPWLIAHANRLDVEISDPRVSVSQVQGPMSLKVLDAAVDGGLPERFHYFDIARVSIGGQRVTVTRTGYTNELGWEFYIEPDMDASAIWNRIKEAGEPFGLGLAGLDAFDPRRIEAGIENAGSDFDATTTPFDVGLGSFVSLEKADFIGRVALERADKRRRLYGLQVEGGTPRIGAAVRHSGEPVGTMTSGAWSPFLQCGVGFVLLQDPEQGPGTPVEVDCLDGASHRAVVCETPMYDAERRIPRGLDTHIPDGPMPVLSAL